MKRKKREKFQVNRRKWGKQNTKRDRRNGSRKTRREEKVTYSK